MWRSGGNTRLLRKRSRVRFPHSENICVHEHVTVCIGSGYFYVLYVCFNKKKVYINPLFKFHNTSLISAYFELDSCECKVSRIHSQFLEKRERELAASVYIVCMAFPSRMAPRSVRSACDRRS
jgi:hypothetical protein